MNQGKLEVVTQEMATVNVDILGISELKWTEMGVFNSDDHYIYYCGQESLRRNGVAIMVTKRVRRDSSPSQRFSERTILHIVIIQCLSPITKVFLVPFFCIMAKSSPVKE